MSRSLEQRLKRLTPDSTGLDRDGLLFAAGRASVRPSRRWPVLAAALAVSQVLTLSLLWPRAAPQAPAPVAVAAPAAFRQVAEPDPQPQPFALGMLRARLLSGAGEVPSSAPVRALVPPGPPLHAFASAQLVLPE
jgi:hypothetical protein